MSTVKVLVIDDDARVQTVTKAYLNMLGGFEVIKAENGARALELLEAGAVVDVIVLDLNMPGMTGAQFMERYRGPAPIMVVSGRADMLEGLPYEPYAIEAKPIAMRHMAETLRAAAASRQRQEAS